MDDQFVDFAKALAARQLKARTKGNILKRDEIRPVDRKRTISEDGDRAPSVTPILDENQEIQGIEVTCSCGQKIHVYFEYQEEANRIEQ